ncbi:MAG: hypothetical protein AAFO79_12565, partial [Pseudomonadota bacterium]
HLRTELPFLDPRAHPDRADCPASELPQVPDALSDAQWELLEAALPVVRERAPTLIDLLDAAHFLFLSAPVQPASQAAAQVLDEPARAVLARFAQALETVESWELEPLESFIKTFVKQEGLKMPQLGKPLRVALTGRVQAPGLAQCLAVLPRAEALARIRAAT